jgi:poly(glycerol-phosphate) alpha-glucosyltransferase
MVSPHGMLDPWALQHSGWKKALAGWAYERRAWNAAACFHALNGQELDGIRAAGVRKPVAVIPNGVELPPPAPGRARGAHEPRRMLFLGRLHPKKNLHVLLEAWNGLPAVAKQGWRLTLAGWGDEAYRLQLTRAAGPDVEVLGAHYGPDKDALFRRASAFILPSLSEGLPMAVLEAWAYGLPVLMSRACNLTDGFKAGAALDSGTDDRHVARAIQSFFGMGPLRRADMGKKGRHLVESQFTWKAVVEKMDRTYAWLLQQADRPPWVVG